MSKGSVKVVGLGGSLAPNSRSLLALNIALEGAAEKVATEVLDLRLLDLPMFRPGSHAVPPEVERMAEAVHSAQGLLWSSPTYHGSISGAFKNAIDWLEVLAKREPPYLTDKTVGLISTAGGVQGLQAVNTMEFIVRSLRGLAIPLVVPVVRVAKAFNEDGRPAESAVERQLLAIGREVARVATTFAKGARLEKECEAARAAVAKAAALAK